jgi:hypothetical protein
MSASGFTLRLEFAAERPGLEPIELVQEFPIDEYKVGNPASVQGKAIVGVEIITHAGPSARPTYRFYRTEAGTAPQMADAQARARCVAIKLRWDDPANPQSISALYTSGLAEKVSTSIPVQPIDGRWLLLLRQAGGKNRLTYQLDPGSGTGNQCADLLAAGINCASTTINIQKMTCLQRGC